MLKEPRNDWPFLVALLAIPLSVLILALSSSAERPQAQTHTGGYVEEITAAILLLQLIVFAYQGWQLRRTVGHMAHAERAYVKLSHAPPGLIFVGQGRVLVEVKAINLGKTPATIEGIYVRLMGRAQGNQLPPRPDYDDRQFYRPVEAFIGGGPQDFISHTRDFIIGDAAGSPPVGVTLWLYGYIDYRDVFGRAYRSGYARRYEPTQDTRERYPTEHAWTNRSNLVYVDERGYNYDEERRS